jgi:hypothetical protein
MQTSGAVPQGCGKLEVDVGCNGVWVNLSGSSTALDPITQSRLTGEAYTLEGLYAIVEGGKLQAFDAVVTIVYTEVAAEAWDTIEAAWDTVSCNTRVCLRYSPGGGNVGDEQYRIPNGILSAIVYPNLNAAAGGPIMAGFTIRGARLHRETITS